jgi:hypothetical protein
MPLETAVTSVECGPAHQSPGQNSAVKGLQWLWLTLLRAIFIFMLTIYVGWNLYWLGQLQIAPSLFQTLTGLPCPTTGCTRSFFAFCRGEILESLRFNALMVPICLLAAVSALILTLQVATRERLRLPNWLVALWGTILPLAWLLKLAGDPRYW